MQEYGLMFQGTPQASKAAAFSQGVMDISLFLARLGLRSPFQPTRMGKAVYQDACHLAQAQRVQAEPRLLLKSIPGLDLLELPEPHICCGSAGTYNLDQPDLANALGERKARAIVESGGEMAITGNIGCMTQLRSHLARLGSRIPVRHTMQVLRDAYRMADETV
jgi:glycolate oxidase iron-sulfur subunit